MLQCLLDRKLEIIVLSIIATPFDRATGTAGARRFTSDQIPKAPTCRARVARESASSKVAGRYTHFSQNPCQRTMSGGEFDKKTRDKYRKSKIFSCSGCTELRNPPGGNVKFLFDQTRSYLLLVQFILQISNSLEQFAKSRPSYVLLQY